MMMDYWDLFLRQVLHHPKTSKRRSSDPEFRLILGVIRVPKPADNSSERGLYRLEPSLPQQRWMNADGNGTFPDDVRKLREVAVRTCEENRL